MSKLAATGAISQGLLRRLREAGGLKPWGAIVYAYKAGKWGMAWSEDTRQAAVASARATCGTPDRCPVEISFFGTGCGIFAHSDSSWAVVARNSIQMAKEKALADCGKREKTCRIVAAVRAGGAERYESR